MRACVSCFCLAWILWSTHCSVSGAQGWSGPRTDIAPAPPATLGPLQQRIRALESDLRSAPAPLQPDYSNRQAFLRENDPTFTAAAFEPRPTSSSSSHQHSSPRTEQSYIPAQPGLAPSLPSDEQRQRDIENSLGDRPLRYFAPNEVSDVRSVSFIQPDDNSQTPSFDGITLGDDRNLSRFVDGFSQNDERFDVGVDLYSRPEFEGGLIIVGRDVAMKIGGYVKADFIYDFKPIDDTYAFDTTTIPVGAVQRTNARYHARQSRLSFDTRWSERGNDVRIYIESDFFSEEDDFRLRHAYGEYRSLLVGKTWTTFTDVAAAPATLDMEGSVSAVKRRQAQARWTEYFMEDELSFAAAIEDTRFIFDLPDEVEGKPRTPSPDIIFRVRLDKDWGKFQAASLYRIVGFQPPGERVNTEMGWGFNFTGVVLLARSTKTYYQIIFGEGIGSYRSLPDGALDSIDSGKLIGLTGWMTGITHDWTESLSSNFTYAENSLNNTRFQQPDAVHRTTYLAANLIWTPFDRVTLGVEYLYGLRENFNYDVGTAHRLQTSFIFDLP